MPIFGETEPRTIIAYVDFEKIKEEIPPKTKIELYAEMPLNHLGMVIEYQDIKKKLEPIDPLKTRAVILWITEDVYSPDITNFYTTINTALKKGVKILLLGKLDILPPQYSLTRQEKALIEEFYSLIGFYFNDDYVFTTYNSVWKTFNPRMVGFERNWGAFKPGYPVIQPVNKAVKVYASLVNEKKEESVIVATFPKGGYIADGFAVYNDPLQEEDRRRWFVNFFLFFEEALSLEETPRPDTTTLCGSRIFYSHIDGDGWNNVSLIPEYSATQTLCCEVMLKEVIDAFPNMPITVAPIAEDLLLECHGKEKGLEIARKILSRPNVEPASHTLSHPFYWAFFKNYTPQQEEFFLPYYSHPVWTDSKNWKEYFQSFFIKKGVLKGEKPFLPNGYTTPRAYACEPFDLRKEIVGSFEIISHFTEKKPRLLQWSGDCYPFEEAVAMVSKNGFLNINGGDTRFDSGHRSYAFVAPIGRKVGKQQQIYASNSNENTYTQLWSADYFGFRNLIQTIINTNIPYRLKPINLYYHTYSLERIASRKALLENIADIEKMEHIDIYTTEFVEIANNFYEIGFERIGEGWKISNKKALKTIRFDKATTKTIDWERSRGVIGQRYLHGSLYIALDPQAPSSEIYFKETTFPGLNQEGDFPFLVDSNWPVINFKKEKDLVTYIFKGNTPLKTHFVPHKDFKLVANPLLENRPHLFTWEISSSAGELQDFLIQITFTKEHSHE